MKPAAEDLLAFCRLFGMTERVSVCCGDVSVSQCVTLQLLLASETDSSSLAEQTGVTKGAVTRLIDGLEKRGWVSKTPDEHDGRRTVLSLTSDGEKKANELQQLTEATVDALLSEIPRGKRKQVIASIRLLRGAAETLRGRLSCPC